jgi:hypothetical protein
VGENATVRHATILEPERLLGEWTLARRFADLGAGRHGTVHGHLVLREHGAGIDWDEQGVLRWQDVEVPVSRSYRLRRRDGGWWVFFADGQPFHPWQPGEWVEHSCRADRYHGLISVDGPDRWRTLWDVVGPGKAQRIVTRFTRRSGRHPC